MYYDNPKHTDELISEVQQLRSRVKELENDLSSQPKVQIVKKLDGPTFVKITHKDIVLVEGYVNTDVVDVVVEVKQIECD